MTVERTVRLVNKLGLHVRPAAKIAELASKYKSEIFIIKDTQQVNAKSIIELLTLAAPCGTLLTIQSSGDDAENVINAIQQLINGKFGEE